MYGKASALLVTGTTTTFQSTTITLGPGTSPGPLPTGPVPVGLPELDTAVASFVPQSAAATRLLSKVAGPAASYRSDFLRGQALAIASEAMEIEGKIADLQALDVEKMTAAQLLAFPALSQALSSISTTSAASLPLPDLSGQIGRLGAAVRDLTLLTQLLDWLARTDILDFWYGLFDALIKDVAGVDASLGKTRAYLSDRFKSTSLAAAFNDLFDLVEISVANQVEALAGAVRAALSAATAALTQETRQLYAAIDAPLTAVPPQAGVATPPSPDDILDANPLANALTQLDQAVDKQLADLRKQAGDAVASLSATGAEQLFVGITVTYVCLPILAAVGVAIAAGPASAAILTAAVVIGGQELVHLIARWLAGPLSEQLDGLRAKVDDARRELEAAIAAGVAASSSAFVPLFGAAEQVRLSGLFLRELSHLVPDIFLSATADLLGRKRDELIRRAAELALAAELAQGQEHGAVFDAIRPTYTDLAPGRLPEAPQLPGGSGRTRHVAETLIADLHRLDEQRLELVDGKQLQITKRISLAGSSSGASLGLPLLSGTSQAPIFNRLLQGDPIALRLEESDLLDGTHPGAYRALIDDVRVFAQVLGPVSATTQIPVLFTHGGVSRTRVRRPGGPPQGLAEQALRLLFAPRVCASAYQRAIAGANRIRAMGNPNFSWRHALAAALWKEVTEAAAVNELVDVTVMKPDWDKLMWSLGLLGVVDGDETDPTVVQQMLLVHATVVLFNAFTNPLPSLSPSHGDPNNPNPSPAQINGWAEALSATLISRSGELARNPLRAFRKWGAHVRLTEEIEPALRDVGFLTLERVHEPQAETVTLAPDAGAALSTTATLLFTAADDDEVAIPSEQKQPFEDLGLGSTLVIQLPEALDDPLGLYSTTAAKIRDIVVELDLRVCHDPELEAAVRSHRRRARQSAKLVADYGRGPVALPGSAPRGDVATTPRRTLQLSVRALRDRALLSWKGAREALTVRGLPEFDAAEGVTKATVDAASFLGSTSPLALLGGKAKFSIGFNRIAPQQLGELADRFTIDPGQLGISGDLFALLPHVDPSSAGALHAVGVAVVPSGAATAWGAGRTTVGSAFTPLLAGLPTPPWPLIGTTFSSARRDVEGSLPSVPLLQLFSDPATSGLDFEIGNFAPGTAPAGAQPTPIHDVIVTFIYSPPAARLTPAAGALL